MFADSSSERGYFPRGASMLRQVHEQRLVGLFYGQRALCVGALVPLNFVGTIENSRAKQTPFKRLVHTGNAFEKIYFGSRPEADKVLAYVDKMHQRVKGVMPQDAGITRKGTPYSAHDPELMLWTVAVIADSAEYFYELFVRKLTEGEREALWQDYIRFAELFGMPREAAPPTYSEFRAWWRGKLASEEIFLTDQARYVGYATAFEIPLPRAHQPAKRVHDLIMLGSLPRPVREHYGLQFSPRDEAAFKAITRAMRTGRTVAPGFVTRGYNTRSFDLVAKTERWRIANGKPTPQVAADGPRTLPRSRYASAPAPETRAA